MLVPALSQMCTVMGTVLGDMHVYTNALPEVDECFELFSQAHRQAKSSSDDADGDDDNELTPPTREPQLVIPQPGEPFDAQVLAAHLVADLLSSTRPVHHSSLRRVC